MNMKPSSFSDPGRPGALPVGNRPPAIANARLAFTLIEMLTVIAIIGVLAGLLFTALPGVKKKRLLAVAQTELTQLQSAIETYHTKLGYYPPDDPFNSVLNPLYFELSGTILTNNPKPTYVTLDGSSSIFVASVTNAFGVGGFANSSKSARNTDDAAAATVFIKGLLPNQIGQLVINGPNGANNNAILVCSVGWPDIPSEPINTTTSNPRAVVDNLNPWHYNSSNPTNNPGSYDLWVDVLIGTKTNRVSNWSKTPQVL